MGKNEDDDYFESLKEYITQEVLQTTQSIIEECENLNQQLKYGKENEDAYYDKETSFFFDKRENCAFAVIVPKTNFEMNIYFRTNQKYGTYYSVYTPSTDDENNNELEVRGTLNYNTNKQESKRLYIGLIKAIIKNCLHNEDFDTSYNTNYVDFIINNTNVNNAIRNAYRELVKTQRNMVKLYSGK